jgi:hypothetical protein
MKELALRMDAIEARLGREGQATAGQPGRIGGQPWPGAAGAPKALPGVAPTTAPPPALTPALARQGQDKLLRTLDASFVADGPAPASDPVPQQVIAAFNSDNILGAIDVPESKDIHCRARMCLIKARFPRGADESDWATRVMLELGSALPGYSMVSIPQPSGGLEVRIYAGRPG